MNKYRILKDGVPVASQMSAETDMRFALAEWLFESAVDVDMGIYLEKEQGYTLEVNGHQFEIQPPAPEVTAE